MALLEIPTRNDLPAYFEQVTLDGVTYQLDFTFNPRMNNGEGKWLIQLSDQLGNSLVDPVPVATNWPLFSRFKDSSLPPGLIFAFDTSGKGLDPGRFDLGDRVRLFYQEAL